MPSEEWRDIPGFDRLEASSLGRIRSHSRSGVKCLAQRPNLWGYLSVKPYINGKQVSTTVHRLVLTAFRGPRPAGKECRHLDGSRTNNCIDNLAWGTRSENQQDQMRHGTASCLNQRGEYNPGFKLNAQVCSAMRNLRHAGLTLRAIGRILGVADSTVCRFLQKEKVLIF